MEFKSITPNDSGLLVRTKLNSMLETLISGSRGANAIWTSLYNVNKSVSKLDEKTSLDYSDLKAMVLSSFDYSDSLAADLLVYINGMNGGVSGFAVDTSFVPDFPMEKAATVLSVSTGTFSNMKDISGNPITIDGENAFTIFYKGEGADYWQHKTIYVNVELTQIEGHNTFIRLRRDTLTGFNELNPVLLDGEEVLVSFDTDPLNYVAKKIGDGVRKFSELPLLGVQCKQGLGDSSDFPISQKAITSWVNSGYYFKGDATPSTNPGEPETPVFYVASEKGTYINFDGIVVDDMEVAILAYNIISMTWHKISLLSDYMKRSSHVYLTEDEYAALEQKDDDTLYFTVED